MFYSIAMDIGPRQRVSRHVLRWVRLAADRWMDRHHGSLQRTNTVCMKPELTPHCRLSPVISAVSRMSRVRYERYDEQPSPCRRPIARFFGWALWYLSIGVLPLQASPSFLSVITMTASPTDIATAPSSSSATVQSKKPSLRLGLYHYPPFYYTEQVVEPYGLAKDLLLPVAKAFNANLEIIPCPFARCLKMLTDGDIDIMPGLIKTPVRAERIHFLQPAMMQFASSFAFYGHKSLKKPVRQFSDLSTLTIAVMRDAAYFPLFDQAKLNKVAVPSESDALYLVQQQHADVAVMVEGTAAGAFAHAGLTMDDLVRQPYAVEQQILGYLGLSKASPWFAKAPDIEQQLQLLYRQGWYERLWLHYQVPLPAQSSAEGQPSVNQAQTKR